MSRINGEKARAHVQRKKQTAQREKLRTIKKQWEADARAAATAAKPAAEKKPARKAVTASPESLVEELRPKKAKKTDGGEAK